MLLIVPKALWYVVYTVLAKAGPCRALSDFIGLHLPCLAGALCVVYCAKGTVLVYTVLTKGTVLFYTVLTKGTVLCYTVLAEGTGCSLAMPGIRL